MITDTSLITFRAISNFTKDLGDVFSDKHRPLKLYTHLINKTTLAHDKAIQKHVQAFRDFCVANRENILEKNYKKMPKTDIMYSKRVFINMKDIFEMADKETRNVIWNHLLTISALVDPTGKAKKILKEQSEKCTGGEVNFLTDIISKVENKVDPKANPMEAIMSIMQSGIFTDLVQGMGSGIEDGSLDLNKLMGTVQTMVSKLSDEAGDLEGGDQALNMINTMMANMQAGSNTTGNDSFGQNMSSVSSDSSAMPPMSDLVGMLGPMMSGLMGGAMPNLSSMMETQSNGNEIENLINSQVEAARASGHLSYKKSDFDDLDN